MLLSVARVPILVLVHSNIMKQNKEPILPPLVSFLLSTSTDQRNIDGQDTMNPLSRLAGLSLVVNHVSNILNDEVNIVKCC